MNVFSQWFFRWRFFRLPAIGVMAVAAVLLLESSPRSLHSGQGVAEAQTTADRALTLRADVQEANAKTGVITARGNVQIFYPSRQIQATAAQAQYFSRERRIILSGNVYVLQEGNSLRGETITYLIDEGRFVALPQQSRQVESIYLVPESPTPTTPAPSLAPQSEFSAPTQTAPAPATP